jgi:CRP-like cAMP-binding protein
MTINPVIYEYVLKEVAYPDKALIVKEGEPSDKVFLLLSGQLKVKRRTGRGNITLETLQPGAVVGEMFLVDGPDRKRSASIVAHGQIRLGLLDVDRLTKDFNQLSPKMKEFIRSLFISLKRAHEKMTAMAGA